MKPLTDNLIAGMIYSLENQTGTFYLDADKGVLVPRAQISDPHPDNNPSRWWPLPTWRSSDGFQLMNRFVDQMNNPVFKPRLQEILNSGQGVFRRFKEALRENREIERAWLLFKESEFKRIITEWYDSNALAAGASSLRYPDPEEEPDTDLVLADFSIIPAPEGCLPLFREWDELGLSENFGGWPDPLVRWWSTRMRISPRPGENRNEVLMAAMDPDGMPAGFVWMVPYPESRRMLIQQLYVRPEYRSLGIGKHLLGAALKHSGNGPEGGPDLITGPGVPFLEGYLKREGWSCPAAVFSGPAAEPKDTAG